MEVDTNNATAHTEALQKLAQAKEAQRDVAMKFGATSHMAETLQEHVNQLEADITPLKRIKSTVGLQQQILRLQKNNQTMQEAYARHQQESEDAIKELQKQMDLIKTGQAKAKEAYQKAVSTNQMSLDKLQAEVNALNANPDPTAATGTPQTTATPTAMVTPQFLSDIVGVLSGLGLLTPNQSMTPEQSAALVQQAVGQIQGSLIGTQQAPAPTAAAAASTQDTPKEEEPADKKMKMDADI